MDDLLRSLGVVFPLFFVLLLGYLIQRAKLISEEVFNGCSTLVFSILMPLHLFRSIGQTDLSQVFEPTLLLVAVGGVTLFWLVCMAAVMVVEKDDRKRGAMVQGAYLSNLVLFGLAISETIAGQAAVGVTAMVITVMVPTYYILAVVCLELFRGGKPDMKHVLLSIIKNPQIIGALCGVLFLISGLKIPALLDEAMADVTGITTPLALIALGGTFHFSALRGNAKQLFLVVLAKLVLMPLAVFSLGAALGLSKLGMTALIGVCATPAAVSTFPMAQKMGSDGQLAGQIVVMTVLFSIPSLFFWVFALSSLGLI